MKTVYEITPVDRNRPLHVPFTGHSHRSRWLKRLETEPPELNEKFASSVARQHNGGRPLELPDEIAGERISIDLAAGEVRIFDPLRDHPDRQMIQASFLAYYRTVPGSARDYKFEDLSDRDLERWQHWIDEMESQGLLTRVESLGRRDAKAPPVETSEAASQEPTAVADPPTVESVAATVEHEPEPAAPVAAAADPPAE